ncbi:bifunctional 2',3'-cyclic-nucleotide 2'-phosphodiesterase/3'-nucleotidase [Bacillus sp. FJAT-18017]|uniref:bifunctional 2',3'-cyclic-nucleotide 2'-phosphodiesterase/3'-nucleotidase n=1 Tax=Bacillus sp. FJAT-18017 TaxID=1705566 RepID=UPI0009EB5289|nr:bifunctional 2',3'-cyclic-nucleotide 2'-phosphodiesterase/3'-nucleotidase [Bacillus sp. FJAT-18017]
MKKKNFGTVSRLTAAALLFSTLVSPVIPYSNAKAADSVPAPVKLRIMETTDLHANVMDYDYFQDKATIEYGLNRTASLIKAARAEIMNPDTNLTYQDNTLLFDGGDLLQGNPLANYVAKIKKLGEDDVHPVFQAMKQLNYDGGIFGNHEFNYGLDFIDNAIEEAPYTLVNANIYVDDKDNDPSNDKLKYTPYKIIDKKVKDQNGKEQTIKVGYIGFTPPQIMQWDKDNLTGKVVTKDMVKSAKKFIPEMKAEGADLIVAIAHSGCDIAEEGRELAENAVYDLTKVEGIDAMLFGHAHLNFPGDKSFDGKTGIDNVNGHIHGVPAVEAGFWGNNLGVMDLELEYVNGKWEVTNSKAANRPIFETKKIDGKDVKVATVTPDAEITSAIKETHEGTLEYVRGGIGETTASMHSYFSRVVDDPTVQLVNYAQMDYVKNWIKTNNPSLADIPVISAAAPYKGGRGGTSDFTKIDKGPLSIKSANDLYLFNNTLKAIKLTGKEVKEWLEMSAAQFKQINPASATEQDLLDYNFRPYNFDQIDGIKYEIDVTKPVRYNWETGALINPDSHRIINFTMMDGTPIEDDQEFIIATNNYRASGGGGFPGMGAKANVVIDSPYENRQILTDYISAKKVIDPKVDNNWKIAPVGGVAKLKFKSSPLAVPFAAETQNIKDLGPAGDAGGFQYFELDQNVYVQFLGINDLHGQLDYNTKVSNRAVGGIEYLAAYLKQREATNPNTLLVEAGDLIGASRPVSALLQDEPTIRFMNELGFDVGTLGNHEFDEGIDELKRIITGGSHPKTQQYEAKYGKYTGADFPIVAANVVEKATGNLLLEPYTIKEVNGVKIGFIGVVTTETPSIVTPSGTAGYEFTDEVEAINKYTQQLKDKGIKAIIVLAHNPGTSAADGSNPTGEAVEIAKAVDSEVDVIYGAHDHKHLNATVNGKLLVQSYSYGTAFSDVDVTIDPITQDIVAKKAEVASTFQDSITPDAAIKAKLDSYKADIAPITEQVIGQAAAPISRTANTAGESAMGNVIADSMRAATGTDFAFMNVGGVRDEIKDAGDITWGELFAVQPFGNDIVTLKITGDQVKTLLNQQWTDRARIMQISGLKYTWTNNLPNGEKVLDIYLPNGEKIDPATKYSVTVNNFMADGGDGFTVLKEGTERTTHMSDLHALVDYVKAQNEPISASIEGRIVLDDKAPEAPQVDEVTDQSAKVTGKTEASAFVEVKIGETVLATGTAEENGSFSIEIPVQKAGTVLAVTATDKAKYRSSPVMITVKDATDPGVVVVNPVTNKDLTITGKAEPGAHVVITDGKSLKIKVIADTSGNFTAILMAPLKEKTTLYVFAIDAANNVSNFTIVTVGDIIPPAKAKVNPVADNSKLVTGTAEPGTTVTVKKGSTVLGSAVAAKDGKFTVTMSSLQKAGTVLQLFVTDGGKNSSGATTVKVVDKTAPITPTVNGVSNLDKKIAGKTEPNAKVTVRVGSKEIGKAVANKSGSFTVTLKSAQKAGTVLYVYASDASKNVSAAAKVTVADKIAPSAPTVYKVTTASKKVTGKAEAGSTVFVKSGSKLLGKGTVAKNGSFSVSIPKQKARTILSVYVQDKAGNKSRTVSFYVVK